MLLARRLVEAGVRFVTVYYSAGIGGWDTHKDNFSTLKDSRLPHTDRTLSALLEDLKDRGLLDETLVYWTGDFGRTPKINKDAGRDHWPKCQSVVMAGGGIRGGRTFGASDPTGAFPKDDPVRPDDITATVFHALGFDPGPKSAINSAAPCPSPPASRSRRSLTDRRRGNGCPIIKTAKTANFFGSPPPSARARADNPTIRQFVPEYPTTCLSDRFCGHRWTIAASVF